MRFRVTVTFEPDIHTYQRVWNRARKAGLRAMGELYASQYLAKHFTHQGAREYGYEPRQIFRRTKGGKLTSRGSKPPLVESGDLRKEAQDSVRVKVYGSRAVIQMDVPWYIRAHKDAGMDLEDELTRISSAEAQAMADAHVKAINTEMAKTPRRRRKLS